MGTPCSVDIVFHDDPGSYAAYGIHAWLNFDPTILQVSSVSLGGAPFGTEVTNTYDNTAGTIEFRSEGGSVNGFSLTVATIVFDPISAAVAAVNFSNVNELITGYGPFGVNGLAVGGTITVTGGGAGMSDFPWSGSGTGTTTVISDGSSGPAEFTYSAVNIPSRTGSWEFRTTAASTGTHILDWDYSGFHAYFNVRVGLDAFIDDGATVTTISLVNAGPANCCTAPSGGFQYSGAEAFTVQTGDVYGFRMRGSHFDRDNRLLGTLTVSESTQPDTTPPVITLVGSDPVDAEAGTSYADAGATALDDVDGDITGDIVTSNPVNVNVLGSYTVTYDVSDDAGNAAAQVTRTVNVVDTTAPVINSVSTDSAVLWPPNNKMRSVGLTVDVSDSFDASPSCVITGVSDNEGNDADDSEITGDLSVELRAERDGGGTGRVYTVSVTCTDGSGNSSDSSVDVTVPHDQGKGKAKGR